MHIIAWIRVVAVGLAAAATLAAGQAGRARATRQLVVVFDGLRPDYVTTDLMPRLAAFAQRGVVFRAHHSVFPTVTRVNVASMVTGLYPEAHGLLGNTIYVPAVNPVKGLDTGSRENLEAVAAKEPLLTAPSLGEILQKSGRKLLSVGSGSSGAVFLLNHTVAGGAILHHEFSRPDALAARAAEKLGAPPGHALPNAAQNRRAVDAYLTIGLDEIQPDVTLMWISDPDTTAHTHGIGTGVTRQALSLVDAEFGRVEDTLRAKGLLDRTNIIVVSDHGFSMHGGIYRLGPIVERFARKMPDGTPDLVVAEGAIYFRGSRDREREAALVAALQQNAGVGAIFTRPSGRGLEGEVPGTLSFDAVRWNHPRAGDVLVASNWSGDKNQAGIAGATSDAGAAGHGTSSPYDVHATLMAAGPDFREHSVSDVPTGNVDLTPTLLRLLGIDVPRDMSGRAVTEGFRNGPQPSSIAVTHASETVKSKDGGYTLIAHFSTAAGKRYLDFTEVSR